MKNISIILNVVLIVAVLVLYGLYFRNSGSSSTPANGSEKSALTAPSGSIVYINTDTLLANYKLLEDAKGELLGKRDKAEKQLQARAAKLQDEVRSYQTRAKAGLLSNNEMQVTEEDLTRKQQELMQYQQSLGAGFAEEERLFNNRLYDTLVNYLKEYNVEKKYQYILNHTRGGTILFSQEGTDITDEVLKGLNERYTKSKGVTETKKEETPKKD